MQLAFSLKARVFRLNVVEFSCRSVGISLMVRLELVKHGKGVVGLRLELKHVVDRSMSTESDECWYPIYIGAFHLGQF